MLKKLYTHWLDSYRGIPRVIWYISIVSLVNRCGAFVISFLSIYMTKHLGFPVAEAGYVMMCFGTGALVGAFSGGKMTDRFGYQPVQFWSLVTNGIILVLMAFVRDIWVMGAAVFAMSFSAEVFRPANSVAMARNCEAETRTRSISLYRMAVNLGWTIAPALGGAMVIFGWDWLFWIDGATCIFAAITLLWLIPKKEAGAENSVQPALEPVETRSPYRDRNFVYFTVLTMLNAMVFMQLLWTIPLFWEQAYGWSEAMVGRTVAINGAIVFLVEMPLIHRLEGRAAPMRYVRFGLMLYAIAYCACLLPAGFIPALAFTIIISFGEIFVMPFSSNFVYGRSEGSKQGQYMALYTMAYSVANIIAPFLGTQLIGAYGFTVLWSWAVLQSLLVLGGFWWLERRLQREHMLQAA